jgi:hypothetical protein
MLQFKICRLYLEQLWVKGLYGILDNSTPWVYENCNVIDSSQVDTLLGIALILGTPFFICLVGSDK